MAKLNEMKCLREALKLGQREMGEAMGIEPKNAQGTWHRWEADPDKPAARKAFDKAKEIYKEKAGQLWDVRLVMGAGVSVEVQAPNNLTPFQAAKVASQTTREVLIAAPHLREAWTDEDQDDFLALVTFLLTQPGGKDQIANLRKLLLHTASGETRKRRQNPASSGSTGAGD